MEAQSRQLERQRNNEFALYQKAKTQEDENIGLVSQIEAQVAQKEALTLHTRIQSAKIEELSSIIQKQQRELDDLKRKNFNVSHFHAEND